jgi:hypothetical protein
MAEDVVVLLLALLGLLGGHEAEHVPALVVRRDRSH